MNMSEYEGRRESIAYTTSYQKCVKVMGEGPSLCPLTPKEG